MAAKKSPATPPTSLRRPRKASLVGGQGTNGKLKAKPKKRADALHKLNDNHRLFIAEYLIHRNASKAYRKAFPDCQPGNTNSLGHRLMADPLIRKPIEAELQRMLEKRRITAERVLDEIGLIAFSNIRDIFNDDSKLIDISELPPEVTAGIKSRYWTEYGERVEIFDKVAALNSLARHFGLFNDSIELKGDAEVLEALREAQARSAKA